MAIYALADLHLSHDEAKPMDIFGAQWDNHSQKISVNWQRVVGAGDLVIVAGDISWALRLKEAAEDLAWVAALPGCKLLVRGNHDYWWSAIGQVRLALPPGMHALQNDHFPWEGWAICGTRGWLCPGDDGFNQEQDEKIYRRELQRLEFSLESARRAGFARIIAALHFPPFNRSNQPSGFTDLLEQAGVRICLYGHIHDPGRAKMLQGEHRGVDYRFVAADGVDFSPVLIER